MSKDIIIVYTDGSSYIHNRGKKDLPKRYFAAYAFAEIDTVKGQVIYQESGAKEHLKTGGSEVLAILNALKYCDTHYEGKEIRIFSDSQYCVRSFNENLIWWAQSGWETAEGDRIKNLLYWKALLPFRSNYRKNTISLRHIKGHSGNRWNDYVDDLARRTMTDYRDSILRQGKYEPKI